VRLRLERYDGTRPFRPWFMQVLTHAVIDFLRRREARGRRERDDALERAGEGESALPERGILREESRARVRRAIQRLPARARLALVLRYYAEQSYAEIAVALDATPEQVGVILHRARRELRERLSRACPPRGPEENT
jgi:RNA polymerase sigma-70 factor (ECF subfamily)